MKRNRQPEVDLAAGAPREREPGDVPEQPAADPGVTVAPEELEPVEITSNGRVIPLRKVADVLLPVTRTGPNARRLDAAHKHLDQMFSDAEGEQIDGRRFWGAITVQITFRDGEACDVLASKAAHDRCSGGRAA